MLNHKRVFLYSNYVDNCPDTGIIVTENGGIKQIWIAFEHNDTKLIIDMDELYEDLIGNNHENLDENPERLNFWKKHFNINN